MSKNALFAYLFYNICKITNFQILGCTDETCSTRNSYLNFFDKRLHIVSLEIVFSS